MPNILPKPNIMYNQLSTIRFWENISAETCFGRSLQPWKLKFECMQIASADVAPSDQGARESPRCRYPDNADLVGKEEGGDGGEGRLAEVLPVALDSLAVLFHPQEVVLTGFLLRRR